LVLINRLYSFRYAILDDKDKFVDLIQTVSVTLEKWKSQHDILK